MPSKRQAIGRNTRNSANSRVARENESEEQRSQRLERNRLRKEQNRERESDEQRDNRLDNDRRRRKRRLTNETDVQNSVRLEDMRNRMAAQRADEAQEVHQERNLVNLRRVAQNRRNVMAPYECLAFHYTPEIDCSEDALVVIGPMNKICQYCNALKYKHECPGMCCASGKVVLPELHPPPEPLLSLVSGISNKIYCTQINNILIPNDVMEHYRNDC